MYLSAVLATGLVAAASTSAFLVPPNVPQTSEEAKSEIAHLFGLQSSWTVELDCPGCPWAGIEEVDGKQVQWSRRFENTLQFQIDADIEGGLLINNAATMPSAFDAPRPVSLVATQRRKDNGDTTLPFPIDFALERLEPVVDETNQERIIVPVRFTVLAFGGKPVKVDTLAIDIYHSPDDMKVLRVEKIPFKSTPGAASCEGQTSWSVCRVKAMIAAHIVEVIRLMKVKAQHVKGWAKGCGGQRGGRFGVLGGGQERPHGHHPHGHHRHHKAHRFARMVHQTLRFFVIPALLGIIGGLIASAVGMLAGQLIIFLWVRFGRNGQRASLRLPADVVEVMVTPDEKQLLMQNQDTNESSLTPPPPPRYQDVPDDVEALGESKE